MAFDSRGYNGNANLKQVGEQIQFTKHQIKEYQKCSESVEYFLENYAKIVSLDDGIVAFEPYPYQSRILNALETNRKVLCKIGRQLGKCHFKDTKYSIRNKQTGEILEISAKEFHEKLKNSTKSEWVP